MVAMATGRSWVEGQAPGVRDDIDRYNRTSSMVPQCILVTCCLSECFEQFVTGTMVKSNIRQV